MNGCVIILLCFYTVGSYLCMVLFESKQITYILVVSHLYPPDTTFARLNMCPTWLTVSSQQPLLACM